jgi:hypothetical protein
MVRWVDGLARDADRSCELDSPGVTWSYLEDWEPGVGGDHRAARG